MHVFVTEEVVGLFLVSLKANALSYKNESFGRLTHSTAQR